MTSKKMPIQQRSFYFLGAIFIIFAQFIAISLYKNASVSASNANPTGPIKRLIITYDNLPEENKDLQDVTQTRSIILAQKNRVMSELSQEDGYIKVVRNLTEMPVSIVEADAQGEAALRANERIVSVAQEKFYKPRLSETIPLLGGTVASGFSDGSTNFTGNGTAVAVIDEGINPNHLMITGSIVSEACYSSEYTVYSDAIVDSSCAGGSPTSTAAGSATRDCSVGCNHGTEVAAAALGRAVTSGPDSFSGVAKASKLIAIKATMKLTEISGQPDYCGDGGGTLSDCYMLSSSGMLSGMNRVLQLKNDSIISEDITAVNYSAGSEDPARQYTDATTCMNDSEAAVESVGVTSLKNANIAVTFASGNSGNTDAGNGQTVYNANADKVGYPACLPGAISVGSSIRTGGMAYYSQGGSRLDLVAPGGDQVTGSGGDGGIVLPGNGDTSLAAVQGTSFAAPLVAGAWSVMREKSPTSTVDTVKRVLHENGVDITENRTNYTAMTHKRIAVAAALAAADSLPAVTSLTVESGDHVAGDSVNITIVATNAVSCSVIGGSGTVTLSGGQGVISVTATSGNQTYNIQCTDAGGYAAQRSVGFVAGESTNNPFPPGNTVGTDGSVLLASPGTPDTGFGLLMNNPVAILGATTIAAASILYIARRYKLAPKRSRR